MIKKLKQYLCQHNPNVRMLSRIKRVNSNDQKQKYSLYSICQLCDKELHKEITENDMKLLIELSKTLGWLGDIIMSNRINLPKIPNSGIS